MKGGAKLEKDIRLLQKIAQLDRYISKFSTIIPQNWNEFKQSEVHKYATERLLHISIEFY